MSGLACKRLEDTRRCFCDGIGVKLIVSLMERK